MFRAALVTLVALSATTLAAEPHTVQLAVDNMMCDACPITVRKALSHVAGVTQTAVDLATHTATVTFDPTRTTPHALAAAVTNSGYPARVVPGTAGRP